MTMMLSHAPLRLGVVSFVNTLPLIDGLEKLEGLSLRTSVPSLLLDGLLDDEFEIGLCSSIDYQRSPEPLVALPAGLLGCDGSTLTVRLYASRPIGQLTEIYCDTDSHTSVVLLRILLRERWGLDPVIIDYDAREHVARNKPLDSPSAVMLIGDKVVTDSPPAVRYAHQLDLGEAWSEMTGLPFVFALWMAKETADPQRLALASMILDRQRRANRLRLESIVHRCAKPRSWPGDLATTYLTQRLVFEVTPRRREGLERFFEKAYEHGLTSCNRPLVFAGS